jgi:membrane-associated phospholipid phosphatase
MFLSVHLRRRASQCVLGCACDILCGVSAVSCSCSHSSCLSIIKRDGGGRYIFFARARSRSSSRAGLVTTVIQYFYHEPRPFSFYNFTPLISESGWSFPSAHAAWFFALALTSGTPTASGDGGSSRSRLLMGIARIYAGVHWPIDIVGGAAVGLLSAWFIHWMLAGSRKGLEM